MAIIPYRPVRGYGASLLGDAQLEDQELQDADLTQPGIVTRGPGARQLAARVHATGGTETPLSATGAQALFYRPDVTGDELYMVHDDTLYASKPTEVTVNGTQAWREVGDWIPWKLRQTMLHQPLYQVRDVDVATIRDSASGTIYQVVVWEQANVVGTFAQPAAPGVYAMAMDENGGIVAPSTLIATGATNVNPRACACDTGVVIMWHDTATATWMGSSWRMSNPIEFTVAAALVAGSAGTAPLFDLRKDGANDQVIAVLADSVGAFSLPLRLVTVSLVVTSLGAVGVVQAPSVGVSVDVDPLGGYLLSWANATTANTVHVDNTGVVDTVVATVVTANPVVRITGCHKDGVASDGTIAVEQRVGASPDYRDHVQVFDYDGAALTSLRTQRGASVWSHALVLDGRPSAWLKHTAGALTPSLPFPAAAYLELGTWILSDLRSGAVLARAFPDQGGDDRSTNPATFATQPCTPHLVQGDLWTAHLLLNRSISALDQISSTQVIMDDGPRKPAVVPRYVLDAHAGYPVVSDGAEAPEADWHVAPTILSLAGVAAGAGKTPGATYVIGVTFLWIDRPGNLWRSAPTVRPITLAAGQNLINIGVQPCRWTGKGTVVIEIWCSVANAGFPLYSETRFVSNSSVDSMATAAGSPDATISVGEQLDQFAPANILGHGTTQVTDFMAFALGRFWSPDPQRPDIIRHTIAHEIDRDGFGWGWEDSQIVQLDTSVRAQAMGPIDGPALAVLAGDVCHLVYGLGPDKQGSGLFGQVDKFAVVDLETSQPLTASVPDSAVPGGLAYATPRGLFILRRDRVSQMLSVQVDRLFRVDGMVPQALAYLPRQGELMLVTLTAEQRSLRLSLTTGRWCADSARRAQDVAVSPRGEVAWLLADARVRILDAALIADGDDNLAFRLTTPTLRIDPGNVAQPVNVQGVFLHTYLIAGPALLDVSIVDARTGATLALNRQTFSVVGPESRSVEQVNLPTFGHRVQLSQPAGDTGRLVIVEIDSQVAPADVVVARTVNAL
jgi:hypothetical protein